MLNGACDPACGLPSTETRTMGVVLRARAHPFGALRWLRAGSLAKNAGRVGPY
jgi:hypothetical protein